MSSVKITPQRLCGTVTPPSSKSDAHRAILCAALADGISIIKNVTMSEDIKATLRCIKAMGAQIEVSGSTITITGGEFHESALLDCGESGSTLRFLLPVAAAAGIDAIILGRGRLPDRPITVLTDLLTRHGCIFSGDKLPLKLNGSLKGGIFELPGDISSQYLSGLLFALPLIAEESQILLTSELESAGYVDMTINTMEKFGVTVTKTGSRYTVSGNYTSCCYTVEGDWSSAAFPIAAGALGGEITILGMNEHSLQGDKQIVEIMKQFGANIAFHGNTLQISGGGLKAVTIDASQIPDMVPALAAVAAFATGDTLIHSAGRLRIKESDRLSAIAEALSAVGIQVQETQDSLIIHGGHPSGGAIDGKNDHRIVMAFSVLAAFSDGETVITDKEAAAKSYPDFFKDFSEMGGICNVL